MSEPDPVAAFDQQREGMKDFARLLGDYFNALLQQGLERTEALKLVRDYQAEFIDGSRSEE